MSPLVCPHSSVSTFIRLRWCLGCGAIKADDAGAPWSIPGRPGDPSAYFDTLSGHRICILDPKPEDYDVEEMAHALSMQARFNGSLQRFYGVGEHSLNVASVVAYKVGVDPTDGHPLARGFRPLPGVDQRRFWGAVLRGLVHDGTESVLGDCIRPLKYLLPTYLAIERLHHLALHTQMGFGADEGWADVDRIVKRADDQVCDVEQHVLRGRPEPANWPLGLPRGGWGLSWQDAKRMFIDVAQQAIRGFAPYREAA